MGNESGFISRGLTRRHLVRTGVAGAAALWFGGFNRLAGLAEAATLKGPLRRASYAGLAGAFAVSVEGATQTLELVDVGDLPVAATRPELRGRDDAFALRLRGSAASAFEQGTRDFRHPELGGFSLFLAPAERAGDAQDYEAIIDRTVPVPGLRDDGSPFPVGSVAIRNHRRHRRHHRHRHRHPGR